MPKSADLESSGQHYSAACIIYLNFNEVNIVFYQSKLIKVYGYVNHLNEVVTV